ncbi:hypothetical protein C8U37_11270 [Trichococcus patagoniensis]|uniref:DUF2798 domain-containing protein n=1 Tax=Trichococcus patagoniensis TaxID=382641 RepID=A0A2T5IJ33_9LACT|nr:DUF2798 domain-containing protein [Trichococcus patagoniensis]PTQ83801.1 hypothetical protein C8U37_11270 [Trichococcus patagoniensis]
MPQNRRESLIYTVLMCFFMIIWMSIYNVSREMGAISLESVKIAWIGMPIAYLVGFICDWFIVSGLAKKFAFHYLLTPNSSEMRKVITISCCMVIPMAILMSMFGAVELALRSGEWNNLLVIWLNNIIANLLFAMPLQLIAAGPIIRFVFRKAFPEGKILA